MPQNFRPAVPAEVDLLCELELEVGDLCELGADEERDREEEGEGGHRQRDDDGLGHVELRQVGMDDAAIPVKREERKLSMLGSITLLRFKLQFIIYISLSPFDGDGDDRHG